MTAPAFDPPHPPGLPIGADWVPVEHTATVRFPFDGSAIAAAPVGTPAQAGQAVTEAVAGCIRDRPC